MKRPVFFSALVSLGLAAALAQEGAAPPPPETVELPAPDEVLATPGPASAEEPTVFSDEIPAEELPPEPAAPAAPPWDPTAQAEQPPRAGPPPDVYVIQRGDTLWDICDKFLGNPWYWPKLWSLNQYIENPHLIYPGNKISFFSGSATAPPRLDIIGAGEKAKAVPERAEVTEPKETAEAQAPRPEVSEPLPAAPGDEGPFTVKLKNLSFISEKALQVSGRISHSGDPKLNLIAGDRVYLRMKDRSKVSVGDQFDAIETVRKVKDPDRGGTLGWMVKRKARIKVIGVYPDTVEGTITESEDSVVRSDRVVPHVPPIKVVTPHDTTKQIRGRIVESEKLSYQIGSNEFIYLNLGRRDGVDDGLRLFVVRRGDGVFQGDDRHLPYVIVARLLVIETGERASTAYVMDLRDALEVGDKVVSVMQ